MTPFSPLPPLAPDFSLNLYQGADAFPGLIDPETGSLQLSDLIGRSVILHFWAGGCQPCQADMPKFQEFFEIFGRTIAVVGIDVGPMIGLSSSKDSIAFLEGSGFTYPIGLPLDTDVIENYDVNWIADHSIYRPSGRRNRILFWSGGRRLSRQNGEANAPTRTVMPLRGISAMPDAPEETWSRGRRRKLSPQWR